MIEKVIEILKNSKCVSIYTHINADCDAMGSSLALREVLISMGKKVDVFVNSNFQNNFAFYGDLSFVNQKTAGEKYDLAVCLDTANEKRLGKYKFSYRKGVKNSILIDHHDLSSEPFCKVNYVEHSSSTAEVLFGIFKKMQINFTKTICKNLLSGILTDTGSFKYSLTENTLFVAGELLKLGGLKIEEVANPIFNSITADVFELMKFGCNNMEFYAGGKLAIMVYKDEDFKRTHTTMDQLDAFPDIPLSIESVKIAILASDDGEGYFRVSVRSKENFSAREVAMKFGGGGHLNASGCKILGEYGEVKKKLIDAALETFGWQR